MLWENSNPNTNFRSQTVSLDLSKYDMLQIFFKNGATSSSYAASLMALIDGRNYMMTMPHFAASGGNSYRMLVPTSTGITFNSGYIGGQGQNDSINIPYAIYGIKN